MSVLTRDRSAEPVSRDQMLRREQGQETLINNHVELTTSRIENLTWLIHTLLYVMHIQYVRLVWHFSSMILSYRLYSRRGMRGMRGMPVPLRV